MVLPVPRARLGYVSFLINTVSVPGDSNYPCRRAGPNSTFLQSVDCLGNGVSASRSQKTRHRAHELPARVQAERGHRWTIRPRPRHAPAAPIRVRWGPDLQTEPQPPARIVERIRRRRDMGHPRPERHIESSIHGPLEPNWPRQGQSGASRTRLVLKYGG